MLGRGNIQIAFGVHGGVPFEASECGISDEVVPSECLLGWEDMFGYTAESVVSNIRCLGNSHIDSIVVE